MKSGKFYFLAIIFIVSLVCISAVSAADEAVNDVIADTNDETVLQESIDDATLADSLTDELGESDEVTLDSGDDTTLGVPAPYGFSNLNDDINGNDNPVITLEHDYVCYINEFNDGVTISRNLTIDGNGYTISGYNRARIFNIQSDVSVVLKNINFIDGNASGNGGAINCQGTVTAINCNFTNNYADNWGGAIERGTAINCTFSNNYASVFGGAIDDGNATNCVFINNYAKTGGAIWAGSYEATVVNCSFIGNNATEYGGAVDYAKVINCNFTNNTCKGYGGAIYDGEAINCIFTGNIASWGGAMASNREYDICIAENCIFTNNSVESGDGGAIYKGNATDCAFTGNSADNNGSAIYKGNATDCNFTGNSANHGGAMYEGNAINCNFIENKAYASGGAIYGAYDTSNFAKNCNFIGNTANGAGAILYSDAIDCNFTQNTATQNVGGAIEFGSATNCIFNNNSAATYGGAIYWTNANNCTFNQNSAEYGGALSGYTATDCTFIDNYAEWSGGAIHDGNAIRCDFIGNSAYYGGAMYQSNATGSTFQQNNATYGGAMFEGMASNCTFVLNTAPNGYDTYDSDVDSECSFPWTKFTASDFNTAYNYGEKFIFKITAGDQTFDGVKTLLRISKNGTSVNYTALSGEGWTVNLEPGIYIVELSIPNSDVSSIFRTITVTKNPAKIAASAVTATYNVNKYLTIKLTDGKGKALSNVKVTVTLGTSKVYTTDKNGQIKINVATLVPKTYTATIKYAGNAYYVAASKSVKVAVKKATPKLTAKAKTFKVKVKTKKYTITLKNNKGKVMKKAKLTLKVGKKTYKATTNSKGKATFKITKLTKKGKYTAVIKYAGSKYYKALSKKVKITVKK